MLASVEGEQGGAWAGRLLLALNGGEGSEVAGGVGEKEVEGREREVLLVAVDWREGKALGWSSCLLCVLGGEARQRRPSRCPYDYNALRRAPSRGATPPRAPRPELTGRLSRRAVPSRPSRTRSQGNGRERRVRLASLLEYTNYREWNLVRLLEML